MWLRMLCILESDEINGNSLLLQFVAWQNGCFYILQVCQPQMLKNFEIH